MNRGINYQLINSRGVTLPSEASMLKDFISKIFALEASASGVTSFKAVVPKASVFEVPLLEVSTFRTLRPETTTFKSPTFEVLGSGTHVLETSTPRTMVPGAPMSEAFITLALALAASPAIAHPSRGTIENTAHQSFEAPYSPGGVEQMSPVYCTSYSPVPIILMDLLRLAVLSVKLMEVKAFGMSLQRR
jgi:hypothetical protein